jgi:hypothetical protein
MLNLPPQPRGCEIQRRLEDDALVLAWREPPTKAACVGQMVLLGFFMLVWGGCSLASIAALVARGEWKVLFLPLFLGTPTTFISLQLRPYLQRRRPESITFNANSLIYDPGTSPLVFQATYSYGYVMKHCPGAFGFWREVFRKRAPIQWKLEETPDFILDNSGKRQRLIVPYQQREIEIGIGLDEADRRWLYAVLEQLRTSTSSLTS